MQQSRYQGVYHCDSRHIGRYSMHMIATEIVLDCGLTCANACAGDGLAIVAEHGEPVVLRNSVRLCWPEGSGIALL